MGWFNKSRKISIDPNIASGNIKNSTINSNGFSINDINVISELLDRKLTPIHEKLDKLDKRSSKNNEALKIYINNNGVDETIKKICNDLLNEK